MLRKKVVPIVLISLFCGILFDAIADDIMHEVWWRGRYREDKPWEWGEDTRWNNPDNYYRGDGKVIKPTAEDSVSLNTGTNDPNVPFPDPCSIDPIIDSSNVGDNKAVCLNLSLPYWQEPNASAACYLYVTGGVLEIGKDFVLGHTNRCDMVEANKFVDNGILEMMGGLVTVGGKLSVGGDGGWFCEPRPDGGGGRGTINMTGGTITCGTFYIPEGDFLPADVNCGGFVYLDGGTIYADRLVMHPNDPNGFMYITDGKLILDGNQISLINGYAGEPNNWISGGEPNWVIQAIYYSDMNTNPEDMDTTRVIARNPELAWTPYPKDDTVRIEYGVTLGWLAGTTPNDVNGHDVYLGTDEASVRDANAAVPLSVYKGRQSATTYDTGPLSLVRGVPYYWRIDEVNSPSEIYKGRVWNFTLDDWRAYNPYPTGTIDTIEPDLIWMPGTDSNTHDVYLGTGFDDVNDANESSDEYMGNFDVNTYDPGLLMLGKTYYWRIDEVNDVTIKGHVWSFTTPEYIVVEDFDSYLDYTYLRAVWHDGVDAGDLYVETDANLVIDGNSMEFRYHNEDYRINKYSETYADTTGPDSLGMDPNFKTYGAKALMVNFYGRVANPLAQPLYVVLEDAGPNVGMATYDDGNAILEEQWHEWNIDLDEFDACGVNLTDVRKVYLGIGVRGNTTVEGGGGKVYFEDIALAASRCLADYGPYVDLSVTPDCFVNYDDLEVLFDAWLAKGYDVNAAESIPYTPRAWYKFEETSGLNAYDSSGNGYTATYVADPCVVPSGPQWRSGAGYDGNNCIAFGTDDANYSMSVAKGVFLDTPAISAEITISAWVKGVDMEAQKWHTLFNGKKAKKVHNCFMMGQWRLENDFWCTLGAIKDQPPDDVNDWLVWEGAEDVTEWTHFAFVKNYNAGEMTMYVDGIPVAMTTATQTLDNVWEFHIGGPASASFIAEDANDYDASYMTGLVDDFRIYRQALSHPEILKLAGLESVHVGVAPLFLPGDPYVDDKIDLKDFAVLTSYWLEVPLWP